MSRRTNRRTLTIGKNSLVIKPTNIFQGDGADPIGRVALHSSLPLCMVTNARSLNNIIDNFEIFL